MLLLGRRVVMGEIKSVTSLYAKYGNLIASGVAEYLFDRIQKDSYLAPFFRGVNMDVLTDHMGDMLSVITGGPDIYKGKDVIAAHKDLKIDETAFNAVVGHLIKAFEDAGIDEADSALVLAELAGAKDGIITA